MNQCDHYEFINKTDRQNLHRQLKQLVACAHKTYDEELQNRRAALGKLLDHDNGIYKAEFSEKVKSRIDEDIVQRRDFLVRISQENVKKEKEFLVAKRIQQYMNSCYEIRENLRRKDIEDTNLCVIEQIAENERKLRRERDLDQYWVAVERTNKEREDKRQANEDCLKKKVQKQLRFTLDRQLDEQAEKRAVALKERAEETAKIDRLIEELRLEEFDKKVTHGVSAKVLAYRNELLDDIARRKEERRDEWCEQARLHRDMINEMQRLDANDKAMALLRKRETHVATMEYIAYVRRLRQLDQSQQKMRDDNIEEQCRVDICTKSNIAREVARKAEIAARCFAELRKQICDHQERRLREEVERREVGIIENRFAPPAIPREKILEQRRKNRAGLDAQIATLRIIRAEEEQRYNESLVRAANDPVFCAEMAEQYMREHIDYLEPHANWYIAACPKVDHVVKRAELSDFPEPGSRPCDVPCGCEKKSVPCPA